MGEPRGEFMSARYATIQVQVTLQHAFWMAQTELTRAQWESVGWPQPKQLDSEWAGECLEPDCPQGHVSFFDAVAFANRFSELRGLPPCYELSGCSGEIGGGPHCWLEPPPDGQGRDLRRCTEDDDRLRCDSVMVKADNIYACEGYRLPTEAEWEYAARAGTTTAFYSGPITRQVNEDCYFDESLDAIGWYCHNSGGVAHPVGQKLPNGWGLFDMSGNVEELCNDLCDPRGYGVGPWVDPTGTLTPDRQLVSPDTEDRVNRGGYFAFYAWGAKSGWRLQSNSDVFHSAMGFRLVRTIGAGSSERR